jgi:glyoxylase-like metal-dependent hydrolase (beta-lactamase superfamily II)
MKRILAVIAAVTLLSLQAAAQNNGLDAGAVIGDATKAMGTGSLRSLQYTGTGSINPTGQAYTTGGAWPRYTVTKYTMSIDYSVPAMRQELVRIDDAKVPRGGGAGGYNPQTFQGGIRPIPGDIVQNNTINGRQQAGAIAFWLTPHGFLKGAAANAATAKASTVKGKRTITFTAFDKFPITATLDNRNLIEHIEALVDIGFTGDTVLDGTYSDYRSLDGIQMPMHLVMREGGWPTLEINVAQARPNSTEAVDVVARATAAPAGGGGGGRGGGEPARPPEPVKIADHVWQLNPAGEGSILVEFNDYIVMVEAPGGDAVTTASIEQAKRLTANKPIKYVINSHHHADHAGGMRAYVAEGIPIITHESHRKYYEEQIFKNPHSLNPDRLARMPRAPMLETMKDKRVITDGSMTLEIYLMKDQPHSEGLLMMYLPKEKIIMQADAYIPRPGAPPLPMPSPYTVSLVDNISRLKLNVDKVLHIHGGSTPYSDVLAAAGRRPASTN